VIGYVFYTPLDDALRRNAQRSERAIVPVAGVIRKWKRMQKPELGEGFDELFTVCVDSNNQFVVRSDSMQ
jgi:hypothetical protein